MCSVDVLNPGMASHGALKISLRSPTLLDFSNRSPKLPYEARGKPEVVHGEWNSAKTSPGFETDACRQRQPLLRERARGSDHHRPVWKIDTTRTMSEGDCIVLRRCEKVRDVEDVGGGIR